MLSYSPGEKTPEKTVSAVYAISDKVHTWKKQNEPILILLVKYTMSSFMIVPSKLQPQCNVELLTNCP